MCLFSYRVPLPLKRGTVALRMQRIYFLSDLWKEKNTNNSVLIFRIIEKSLTPSNIEVGAGVFGLKKIFIPASVKMMV